MLFITRKPAPERDSVWIITPEGKRIRVVVRRVDGNQVRLGFTADTDVKILREELTG
jgi:sRNA-binding carbon storage regulator CsrA